MDGVLTVEFQIAKMTWDMECHSTGEGEVGTGMSLRNTS